MINLNNKQETKAKVQTVIKKRKTTKKEQEKQKKYAKFLIKFIIIEYITCGFILLTGHQIKMMRDMVHLENINEVQEETIFNQQITIDKMIKHFADSIENDEDAVKTNLSVKATSVTSRSANVRTNVYNVSNADRELIAKLLYHEARGESVECQRAVVSVIFNRLKTGYWGDTFYKVIYAKNQFEPVARGLINGTKPSQAQYDAVDYVIKNGVTVPENVIYFRANYFFDWATDYISIDNTYFSR